jgi:hypothetical protein
VRRGKARATLKILLFGYGSIGRRHARNLHALGHHVVAADPFSAPPAPDGTVALFYRDWRRALADHGDAAGVVIASPTAEHAHQLAAAMVVRGLPVYCEKPLVAPEHVDWLAPANFRERCAVGFQYAFHPLMPSVERLARTHGELNFRGQDDLLARYGPDVEGVMVAHPVATALRLLGPAEDVRLFSDGVSLGGTITHQSGARSLYLFRMDRGPRESWAGAGPGRVALTPDDGMYRACLGAWLATLAGGERDPRLATLALGLAVSRVLAQVRRYDCVEAAQ